MSTLQEAYEAAKDGAEVFHTVKEAELSRDTGCLVWKKSRVYVPIGTNMFDGWTIKWPEPEVPWVDMPVSKRTADDSWYVRDPNGAYLRLGSVWANRLCLGPVWNGKLCGNIPEAFIRFRCPRGQPFLEWKEGYVKVPCDAVRFLKEEK